MCFKFVFIFLVSCGVYSEDLSVFHLDSFDESAEDLESGTPKYIDIYTNHKNVKEVLKNYYDVVRKPKRKVERLPVILHDVSIFKSFPRLEKIIPSQIEENVHVDRVDFHYPYTEILPNKNDQFSYKNEDKDKEFIFMQSQKVVEDSEENYDYAGNKRPKFHTQNYDEPGNNFTPVKYSYVQKIPKPKPNTNYNNKSSKYEEIDVNSKTSTTKARINQLLKRFLTKLYSQKYNNTRSIAPQSTFSKFNTDNSIADQGPKKKFLDSDTLWQLKNKTINKINKFFSLFTIVQFNNTQCNATNSAGTYQGICYTTNECSNIGGTALGNCASGYGVCCVSQGSCGGSSSQNCTYFQSPNYPDYYPSDGGVIVPTTVSPTTQNPSPTPDPRLPWYRYRNVQERQSDDTLSCTFNVYKLNSNISKMRIDFLDLELIGPTNGTCTTERLVISGQNSNNQIPDICGYNTGQHVYVDVSSLSGPLQLSVLATMVSRKRFRIRVCQYEDSCLEPSSNCLQYYTGVSGVISSFNYDQASLYNRSVPGYFNNLNYAICIRREEGYCSISYTNVVNGVEYPFQLRNIDDSGIPVIPPGQAGADIFNCPDDYIVIDGTRLCGDKFNDGTTNDDYTMNAVVTDTGAGPIVIPVRTDSMVTGVGFKLFYTQNPCIMT